MRRIDILVSAPDHVPKEQNLIERESGSMAGSARVKSNGHAGESEPFRGLQFFDFEHAPIFHGRTKAIGEVLDALNEQARAKKPFVLVLGGSGSGKSSLVRAGVLPLLTEVGTMTEPGPWRHAITRPGSGGDPFAAFASALFADRALPELQKQESREGWRKMAGHLREDPDSIALRIKELLNWTSLQDLGHLLNREDGLSSDPERIRNVELATQRELGRAKPKKHLALFIDQLEDLFTSGFSLELQQRYITAVAALVRCQVHVIAALRSDFYGSYQRFPELIDLASPSGRYDLQAPSREELGKMIRLPAEAAGLKFERDLKTDQNLDEALADAAVASTDPLPLLEHLLLQLYRKQAERRDGLLQWADYRDPGELEGALAYHAERVFTSLNSDARQAFDFVMRRLVSLEADEKACSRSVPYRDLVASCESDSRFRADAKSLVDAMAKEGLFSAEIDHKREVIINVAHPALLQKWPRVREWLIEDQEFLRMRDRVNGCLKLWLKRGRKTENLLSPGLGLADGVTLLNRFRASLSGSQIEYIQKSLAEKKRNRWITYFLGLPVLIALISLAVIGGVHWFRAQGDRAILSEYRKLERKIAELLQTGRGGNQVGLKEAEEKEVQLQEAQKKAQAAQQGADLANAQRAALEAQLKQTQDNWQLAQKKAELVSTQRSALEAQLKQAQDQLKQAEQTANLASTQRSALEGQLKQGQDQLQQAEETAEIAATQRSGFEAQLKQSQGQLKQAEQTADLASTQRSALEAQLKQAQDRLQQAEQTVEKASTERSALEGQLKQSQDQLQQAEQTVEKATTERSALEGQLKQSQDKLQQAEKATTERSALEGRLKQSQDQLQQAEQTVEKATTERSALEGQLKQSQDKLQQAEQAAEKATTERSALEGQLKQSQDQLQQAEQTAEKATTERSALEGQLKQNRDKLQQAEETAEKATTERSALEGQLKQSQDKLQQAEETAEKASTQRSALEGQLKQSQDKLQQAEEAAEKVSTQRSALEGQLKQSQDKLQQAEEAAEKVSTQRSALEGQLKQSQDKLQQAEEAAEKATTQRSALEGQLKQSQERLQQAEQTAEKATTERSALEGQLRQRQDQLQQAEQRAEKASTERSALESQLNESQDQLQQAEQRAEKASTERSALEGQLKKAEENAQLLQRRTELADTQRSAMEVQLKRAEEKAQLAQKIADLIAAQAHPDEPGPSKREPEKKNSESTNQLRSGRALPLDAGQNLGLGTSTQPLMAPVQSANH
jgi:chromosome segregation ATPase